MRLTPTGGSLPASRSLSPLNLPIPAPFQHAFSTERTTTTPVENTFPPVPPYPYADPFPGNRLTPIPNLEASNDPTRPTSPPYDPEQVVRDREALRLPSPPPQASAPSRVPTPPVISRLASPIIVDVSTPQSPTIPLETDWHDGARESEAIWPGPPTPALPLPRPLPLQHPHPLPHNTIGSVATQGISSQDVQLRALEHERMSRQGTGYESMMTIGSWLLSFVFAWSR